MPPLEDEQRLRHMLDHAVEAAQHLHGKTRHHLASNRLLQLGLARLVEIIGEAATHVSKQGRERVPCIPWEDVTGMRHRIVHAYDDIDLDVLYATVVHDLPPLISALQAALDAVRQ